jgi:hypothetical protein
LKHHSTVLKLAKLSNEEAERLGLNQILIQENIVEMIQMSEVNDN